jgi:hypothetical protein
VFQAVFAWATPLVDLIDAGVSAVGGAVGGALPDGVVRSFIVDGAIAGVGSVIVFLPQILILFLFIILLEDTGYLARAAFLVDRAMRTVGLSGQSVIPLLSSFACAVPSIMATRVIPNRRDRIATILAAPFMTCSARLPIYALLIGAFVPVQNVGIFNLQGLVLFGLYGIGIVGGVATALLLRRSVLRGANPTFILALPEFRMPNVQTVGMKLLDRVRVFLRRAGTVSRSAARRRASIGRSSPRRRGARGPARRDRQPSCRRSPRAELAWACRARHRARIPPARLGLALVGGGDRGLSCARGGRRRPRHDIRGRRRSRRSDARLAAQGSSPRRRQPHVHAADGVGSAPVLRLVLAVCCDARRDTARDEQLAMAGVRMGLHDGARLYRSVVDLSARLGIEEVA